MPEVEILRHNADPQLGIWGWQIALYLFLGGLSAGLMIVSALTASRLPLAERSRAVRFLPFLAPLVLSVGMLALLLDLENPARVHRFYMAIRPSSAMWWGAWILIGVYPVTLLFGLSGLDPAEREKISRWRAGRVIGRIARWVERRELALRRANLAFGIALGGYTGILLASMGARAAWGSMLLGPLFLVSGLSTGAAVVMLLPIAEREHQLVQRWDVWAIAGELVLLALFFLELASSGSAGREALAQFWGGRFTTAFWTLVVAVGLLTPLALELSEALRKLRPAIAAPVLILVGGVALRCVLVFAGQS